MNDCPYYKVERKTLESKKINADRQRKLTVLEMPWCGHPKHSPVDRHDATKMAGGGNLLKCEGNLENCHLTPEQFEDHCIVLESDDGRAIRVEHAVDVAEATRVAEQYAEENSIPLSSQAPQYTRVPAGHVVYDFLIVR